MHGNLLPWGKLKNFDTFLRNYRNIVLQDDENGAFLSRDIQFAELCSANYVPKRTRPDEEPGRFLPGAIPPAGALSRRSGRALGAMGIGERHPPP